MSYFHQHLRVHTEHNESRSQHAVPQSKFKKVQPRHKFGDGSESAIRSRPRDEEVLTEVNPRQLKPNENYFKGGSKPCRREEPKAPTKPVAGKGTNNFATQNAHSQGDSMSR